jgi:hypothetical protein
MQTITLINILNDVLDSPILVKEDRVNSFAEDVTLSLLKLAQADGDAAKILSTIPNHLKHLPVYRGLAFVAQNANIKGPRTFVNQYVRRNPVDALWGLMVAIYLNHKPEIKKELFPGGNRFLSISNPETVRSVLSTYNAQWGQQTVQRILGFDPIDPGWSLHIDEQITPIMESAGLSVATPAESPGSSPTGTPAGTPATTPTGTPTPTPTLTPAQKRLKRMRDRKSLMAKSSEDICNQLNQSVSQKIESSIRQQVAPEELPQWSEFFSDIGSGGLGDVYSFSQKYKNLIGGIDSGKMARARNTLEDIMRQRMPPEQAIPIIERDILSEVDFAQHGKRSQESPGEESNWNNPNAILAAGAFLTLLNRWSRSQASSRGYGFGY